MQKLTQIMKVVQTIASWAGSLCRIRERWLHTVVLWSADDVTRIATGAPMRSVSQVTPQLHLGGQYGRRGWSRLAARGITSVVSLRAEFDDRASGIAPARYLYLPTADDEAPTLEQLHEGVTFIAEEIAQGGGVYVHCNSGVGRAATLVAAYLVNTGLTPNQAWTRIREVRPFACPTPAQTAQVERFASLTNGPIGE
jgi:predicted protein tyrosine phosphatase